MFADGLKSRPKKLVAEVEAKARERAEARKPVPMADPVAVGVFGDRLTMPPALSQRLKAAGVDMATVADADAATVALVLEALLRCGTIRAAARKCGTPERA